MRTRWLLQTNAKSVKNAQVLLNQVARHLDTEPEQVAIDGDRYCGHVIEFALLCQGASRGEAFYALLRQAEQLANSWTLSAVSSPAAGWSTRSRIAGVQRLEWREASVD